ncbi:hypothetical protein D3C73_827450 [compost metagenome]
MQRLFCLIHVLRLQNSKMMNVFFRRILMAMNSVQSMAYKEMVCLKVPMKSKHWMNQA